MAQSSSPQASQATEASESGLLDLPAELRNEIYRLVVLKDEAIPITTSGIDEPFLLRACKQIRDEAFPIFYAENKFEFQNDGFDSDLLLKWEQRAKCELFEKHEIECNIEFSDDRTPDWQKLLEWLERYHADVTGTALRSGFSHDNPQKFRSCQTLDHLVASMFNIIDKTRSLPWKEVEELLEDYHKILILHDKQWE